MDASMLKSLFDPAILFFFLGVVIGLVRSNLEIPAPIAKFLSLYLLMAIGFKGGQALADAGFNLTAAKVLGLAIVLAVAIPAWSFLILRRRTNPFDAAAIAATYGSVSAVTFITASEFLANRGEEAGGYLTVALVVMESPAIIMAVLLATWVRARGVLHPPRTAKEPALVAGGATAEAAPKGRTVAPLTRHDRSDLDSVGSDTSASPAGSVDPQAVASPSPTVSLKAVLHEAFTDGAHLLLIGSLVIGAVSGDEGGKAMNVFVDDIFKGLLGFFLLEMGLLVSRRLREVRDVGPFLVAFGLVMPLVNGAVAMALGRLAGLDTGDLTLLTVLAASASYIVVPAVIRFAIPEALPSRYFTMALGVTFPFNIIIGIPLYYAVASAITS